MSIQPLLFDYAALDADTRSFVEQKTDAIRAVGRRMCGDIATIGTHLIDVKARLSHGQFGAWLSTEFGMAHSTANNYMAVARTFPEIPNGWEIEVRALYAISAKSTPVEAREQFIAEAEAGRPMSYRAAVATIAAAKSPVVAPEPDAADEPEPEPDGDVWIAGDEIPHRAEFDEAEPDDIDPEPDTEPDVRRTVGGVAQAEREQATSDRMLSIVGDPEGRIERAKLRSAFSTGRSITTDRLLLLRPDALATVITPDDVDSVRMFIRDCRAWLADLESHMGQGIRVVSRRDA